jgi:hypothetical protein
MKKVIQYNLKLIRLISLFLTGWLSVNCESFVEVDLPDSQITNEVAFSDIATAEATMANIYSKLVNDVLVCGNSSGVSILMGSYADELKTYNSGLIEFQFYQNSLIATDLNVSALWNKSYNLIYAANSIIEGLRESPLNENDKNRLISEALFFRAFLHFYLLNLYGDIPYVTTTDYEVNASIGKYGAAELYPLIITDLEEAKMLSLSSSEILPNHRVGSDAIRSFLARVYLYDKQWEKAEMEANSVIHSGAYHWVASPEDVFLKNSTGTIWQLKPTNEGVATQEAQNFVFSMGPPPNRALNENLINAFEAGDLRIEKWVGSVTTDNEIWYYPYKYKQYTNEAVSSEYSIMIRLEELYLIRAEALLKQGNIDGAKADINKIRNRAGLSDVISDNEEELLDAILHERRIELFCELGHRFFDLKRTGKINAVLSPIKQGWNATDVLLPIPESELLLNSNLLPQNQGY